MVFFWQNAFGVKIIDKNSIIESAVLCAVVITIFLIVIFKEKPMYVETYISNMEYQEEFKRNFVRCKFIKTIENKNSLAVII